MTTHWRRLQGLLSQLSNLYTACQVLDQLPERHPVRRAIEAQLDGFALVLEAAIENQHTATLYQGLVDVTLGQRPSIPGLRRAVCKGCQMEFLTARLSGRECNPCRRRRVAQQNARSRQVWQQRREGAATT